MVPYVLDLAGVAHLAVDVAGDALEAANQKAEMLFLVRGAVVYAQDCMKVIRHHHKLVKLELGIFRGQLTPIRLNMLSQLVQFAFFAHYGAEDGFVAGHLECHEEPAIAVVDIGVPERLAKLRGSAIARWPTLIALR